MKRICTIVAVSLAMLVLMAGSTDAKRHKSSGGGALLRIHVTNDLGRPVAHARIRLHAGRKHARGVTDRGGLYAAHRRAGTFAISVSHPGYLRAAAIATVGNGEESTVHVRLLRRRVVLPNAHELHHLGILDRDGLHKHGHHVQEVHPDGFKTGFGRHK